MELCPLTKTTFVVIRRLLYSRLGNSLLRTSLKPFASIIPERLKFPVSGTIRVRFPGNRELSIFANPTCFAAKQLFWHGPKGFEPNQFDLFTALAREASVFLDIGANVGYYSLLASLYNPSIQVHAFEPLPAAFRHLQFNCSENGFNNVTTHQLALSDSGGEATFYAARNPKFDFVQDQLTATGSLDRLQADRTSELDDFKVQMTRLDDFVRDQGLTRLDLIKMDTEATEHQVIAGGADVISRFKPVIFCEVLAGRVEAQIDRVISDLGYLKFVVTPAGLVPARELAKSVGTSNDHVFCHASCTRRLAGFLATG